MRIVSVEESAYFANVTCRYDRGVTPSILNYSEAHEAKCHENANAFFARHADYPPVRGWLVTELANAPGCFRLVAHSVNRTPNGILVDVTPLRETDRKAYRFVEHEGSEACFNQLRTKFPEMYFPIIDALSISAS
jgi:hypothetical protein